MLVVAALARCDQALCNGPKRDVGNDREYDGKAKKHRNIINAYIYYYNNERLACSLSMKQFGETHRLAAAFS